MDVEDGQRLKGRFYDNVSIVGWLLGALFNFAIVGFILALAVTGLVYGLKLNHTYHKAALMVSSEREQSIGILALAHCRNKYGTLTELERAAHPYVDRVDTADCDAATIVLASNPKWQWLYAFLGELSICKGAQCGEMAARGVERAESLVWIAVPSIALILLVLWMAGILRPPGHGLPMHYGQGPIFVVPAPGPGSSTFGLQQRLLLDRDSRSDSYTQSFNYPQYQPSIHSKDD